MISFLKKSVQWKNILRPIAVATLLVDEATIPFSTFYLINLAAGKCVLAFCVPETLLAEESDESSSHTHGCCAKFWIPQPLSIEHKTMSKKCPISRDKKTNPYPCFPNILPWLAQGPTPEGSQWTNREGVGDLHTDKNNYGRNLKPFVVFSWVPYILRA